MSQENLDHEKFVTVFKTGHHGTIALIKSLLDSADIKYFVKNENAQDLFGGGIFGVGYNPVIGPVQVQVLEEDAEDARELLKDISETPVSLDDDDDVSSDDESNAKED
jgi:hypothetical protein